MTTFVYNDGGRKLAGRKGDTGDCVTRAVAIASGLPYLEVYNVLAEGNKNQRQSKRTRDSLKGKRTASNGIYVQRKWFKDYMISIGFEWVPTMQIGQGCKVHLKADELPKGRLVCNVSKHCVAVIDGVINDTYDCSREGTRCVYGYWIKKPKQEVKMTKQTVTKEEAESLKKEGFDDELINKLFKKKRVYNFSQEQVRQYAIRVLAVLPTLSQAQRKRVLKKAVEMDSI